jgi:serine/threonine-protein kinase
VAALLREAVITGALEHPGIVPVHALGIDDRDMPLVMKRPRVEWRICCETSSTLRGFATGRSFDRASGDL